MKLSKIQLTNFKNYKSLDLAFSKEINCFVGENGEGKTNLLDAIFYLCIGKSHFNSVEKLNRIHGSDFLRISGKFAKADKTDVVSIVSKRNAPKKIEKNKLQYDRVSEHLGFAPISFIAPDDAIIIQGGSEFRRKFINTTLSQINKNYLLQLIEYRKVLQQKNAFLKKDMKDRALLKTYNELLVPLGESIFKIREAYVAELSALINEIYEKISNQKEELICTYQSQLSNNGFDELLTRDFEKEQLLQRSTVGIHKDDIAFFINGYELKKVGSQGQQKTALLALKLAEYQLLANYSQLEPLLLLDDIFDKLDHKRVEALFRYITSNFEGQLFLSDTNGDRLQNLLSRFNKNFEIFVVNNNNVESYEGQ